MAVVVPLVAAFATGAAGYAAATAVGASMLTVVSGYAMVAGAVLTGVGAVTGKKDLMKIGGILSLAGGIGSMAGSAITAAGETAANEAAGELARETARGSMTSAATDSAAYAAQDAAFNAAREGAGGLAAEGVNQAASNQLTSLSAKYGGDSLIASGGPLGGAEAAGGKLGSGLYNTAPSGTELIASNPSSSLAVGAPSSAVQQAGANLSASDIGDYVGKVGSKLKDATGGIGSWIKDNKELVKIVGDAAGGLYGADAQMVSLRQRQLDQEQSLIDRAYKNLNTPVTLQRRAPTVTIGS